MDRHGLRLDKRGKGMILALLVMMLFSLLILRPVVSSVDTWKKEMQILDSKRGTVISLLGSSSAASAVITLIPDDVGTPIAQQLTDLSVVFLAVLSILMAEKYLLPLLGAFTSTLLIPATCALYIFYSLRRENKWLFAIAFKLTVLAVALLTIIPASIYVSNTVDRTFEASINNTINGALESNVELNVVGKEDGNLWEKITGAVSGALDYVGKAVEIAKKVLSNYTEAAAVMLVTSCVIPIAVLFIYIMIIKYVFSLNFSVLNLSKRLLPSYREKTENRTNLST